MHECVLGVCTHVHVGHVGVCAGCVSVGSTYVCGCVLGLCVWMCVWMSVCVGHVCTCWACVLGVHMCAGVCWVYAHEYVLDVCVCLACVCACAYWVSVYWA